jgi:hypothetical protein
MDVGLNKVRLVSFAHHLGYIQADRSEIPMPVYGPDSNLIVSHVSPCIFWGRWSHWESRFHRQSWGAVVTNTHDSTCSTVYDHRIDRTGSARPIIAVGKDSGYGDPM